MPGLGLGLAGLTDAIGADGTMAVIVDYFWELVDGNLQPLAKGTVSDFNDTWDIDSDNDYMPEALPNNEGYWDDFSTVVTNGELDADSDWTKGTGWTISGGSANSDGTESVSYFRQNSIVDLTSTYNIQFTVSKSTSGTLNLLKGNGSTQVDVTSDGTYNYYTTWDGSTGDIVFQSLNFIGSINNISVKEYALTSLDV